MAESLEGRHGRNAKFYAKLAEYDYRVHLLSYKMVMKMIIAIKVCAFYLYAETLEWVLKKWEGI